ncbi:CGNR zinc finger domain-containing protein [Actinopolyspora sp. H202]|uniref:CGNR zinc finger domain-containing protein n=1 Tax=Actinopolyspora sp. H202 TaxID=1500456 RepID=UPI003EE6D412
MDNADYTAGAIRLANADLTSPETLREVLRHEPWWAQRITESDLRVLREVAAGIRRALAAARTGDASTLLAETNELLAAHPPRPRLSDHGAEWHIHVADVDEDPAVEMAAVAAWGLAQGVVLHGSDRWGRCAAPDCENYFLDTTANRTKQFCSARCANRVNVAAFRARNRE